MTRWMGRMTTVLALSAWTLAVSVQAGTQDVSLNLAGTIGDMDYDAARERIYLSIPSTGELVQVSAVTFEIEEVTHVGTKPQGLALSLDGTRLFIAMNASASVRVLDLATTTVVDEIFIGDQLDDVRTWDVIEAQADRLFVSGNPSSNGFAYIVQVRLDQGNAATRVASNRIIRAAPVFEVSPDRNFLYVGEVFSPNSLYKLDLSDPAAPIVLEDDHGAISGTNLLEISPEGDRIFLTSGQVVSTATLDPINLIGAGTPQYGGDPLEIFVAAPPNLIKTYDTTTYVQSDQMTLNCSFSAGARLLVLPAGRGFLTASGSTLCGRAQVGPPDCNDNGVDDALDILNGTSHDCDASGVPDECEQVSDACPFQRADVSNDGVLGPDDLFYFVLTLLGSNECGCAVEAADLNGDGLVDANDVPLFVDWLQCTLGTQVRVDERAPLRSLARLAREIGVSLDLEDYLIDRPARR